MGKQPAPTSGLFGCRNTGRVGSSVTFVRTLATLEAPPGAAAPGAEPVVVPISVHNTSDIVQAYDLEPLGLLASYATIDPPVLNLYPGTAGEALVSLVIPRSGEVPAGDYPFGVKVTPTESPEDSVTQETTVQVLPFLDTTAELVPRTSRGRNGAIHDLAVDNRGNIPVRFLVAGADDAQALKFDANPQSLEVGPGEARFAEVKVKPVQKFWRGPARTLPFLVTVTPEEGAAVVLDGTHLQEPRIPKWFWKALLALLALLLLLLLLWFLLLRPAIESVAEDAVADDVVAAEEAADDAGAAADDAGEAAVGAAGQAESAQESAEEAATLVGKPGPTVASSERLEASVSKGATGSDSFALGDEERMDITDVVFENPQGDSGTIELIVGGSVELRLALENFRSIDYHFVTPIAVAGGESVAIKVTCNKVGKPPATDPAPSKCLDSAFVGGTTTPPP